MTNNRRDTCAPSIGHLTAFPGQDGVNPDKELILFALGGDGTQPDCFAL